LTWMAAGAWSGPALVCATEVNAAPFREKGPAAEPRHFDPWAVLAVVARPRAEATPQMRVRVSVLKEVFIDNKPRG
jgi:hypothetical protein